MSQSSEYLKIRAERKALAEKKVEANAKAAQRAKDKAQGKASAKSSEEFALALEEKQATRAANYSRATTLPAQADLDTRTNEEKTVINGLVTLATEQRADFNTLLVGMTQ